MSYVAPRRAPIHRLVGDATPTYLYWPHALERMQAFNPAMPLIAVFRDPIERLFSHWVMLRSRNLAWPDWPDFLTEWPHTSLPDEVPTDVRTMRWRHMTGLARGFYGEQLQRGFELFGREQWLLLELRAMLGDFEPTVHRTTDFLGLPRFDRVPPLRNWHAGAEQIPGTPPTAADLAGVGRPLRRRPRCLRAAVRHRHRALVDPSHPRRDAGPRRAGGEARPAGGVGVSVVRRGLSACRTAA